jgi:hypothetical protein
MRLYEFLSEDDTQTINARIRLKKQIQDLEKQIQSTEDKNTKEALRKRKEALQKSLERYRDTYRD